MNASSSLPGESGFPIQDSVGAWVEHGRFVLEPTASGPLSGLSFAVKDIFDVAGHPTGAGNPTWLATHPVPDASSPIVNSLRAAGATLVGKVMTDELAYSINGDNVHYGTPINACAPGRVPGGSSSGSAAAVAARLCDFALASDTGGSTRVPASYCGLYGLRTTHGLLPRAGMLPLHPFFDTATWLAHDARTFALVADVLLPASAHCFRRLLKPAASWALADACFKEPLNRVLDAVAATLDTRPEEISLSAEGETLDDWRQTYVTAGAHEAWQTHGTWIEANQPRFSEAITARWAHAASVSDTDGNAARQRILALRAHIRGLFGDDAIAVIPSSASIAPECGASGSAVDSVRMRTLQITCLAGIGGLCQVSIPFTGSDGLPLGVSLVGPAGSDAELVRFAIRIAEML